MEKRRLGVVEGGQGMQFSSESPNRRVEEGRDNSKGLKVTQWGPERHKGLFKKKK